MIQLTDEKLQKMKIVAEQIYSRKLGRPIKITEIKKK